jgi:hypothetical protein
MGNAIQYLTNTLIKLDPGSKLDESKKYQIKGYEVSVELIKSRTAPAGSSAKMVYNQTEGFDNDLSIYDLLNSNKLIKGSPVAYRLEGLDDPSFRLSTLKEMIETNEEFRNHYYALADSVLGEQLPESSKVAVLKEIEQELVLEEDEDVDVAGEE